MALNKNGERKYKRRKLKCRECGREFEHDHFHNICPDCFGRLKKEELRELNNFEKDNRMKIEWMQRIGLMRFMRKGKEQFKEIGKLDLGTEEICAFCGKQHLKSETYFHEYKTWEETIGLPITELKNLLDEFLMSETNVQEFLVTRFDFKRCKDGDCNGKTN